MRHLRLLDMYRLHAQERKLWRTGGDDTCGAFQIPSPIDGQPVFVIASSGEGWDHVSVSRISRCPNWPEMEHVKRMFFRDDETAMQLHVPQVDHINCHPYCLHLWRPLNQEIPRPPAWMIAPTEAKAS